MNIIDLWLTTMNDPDLSLRWSAIGILLQIIQTTFLIISGIVVFLQVRQIRKDAIEKKITGLNTAIEALDNEPFNTVSIQAASGRTIQGVNWRKLLRSINLVALLVKEDFTNLQLLLAMKGKELYEVGNYIQKNGLPDQLKNDLDDQFKPAMDFLKDVCQQAKKLGYVD